MLLTAAPPHLYQCNPAAAPTAEQTVFANLDPGPLDVDLGAESGPHFAPAAAAARYSMAVRVASVNRLITFQVRLEFDPTALKAADWSYGADWQPESKQVRFFFLTVFFRPLQNIFITP